MRSFSYYRDTKTATMSLRRSFRGNLEEERVQEEHDCRATAVRGETDVLAPVHKSHNVSQYEEEKGEAAEKVRFRIVVRGTSRGCMRDILFLLHQELCQGGMKNEATVRTF